MVPLGETLCNVLCAFSQQPGAYIVVVGATTGAVHSLGSDFRCLARKDVVFSDPCGYKSVRLIVDRIRVSLRAH